MKVGIMGGTFDPIHQGHLLAAERAREEAGLDEVWFMPSNTPPHKPNAPKATAEQRLAMVKAAIAGNPFFRAEEFEIVRGGTSYTVDTMRELKEREPEVAFHYIIGADMVQYLPNWARIEELVKMVTFVGLARPGYPSDVGLLPPSIRDSVLSASMPQVDVSSTMIRHLRAAGRSIRYLVPDPVLSYIEENRLYES
ncbi:nicotinate-nucleotide adenylyltransferase [Paenibacillus flagellatus]|uniref:Probable nicotinate-nucleotide adenylyltransferase n=1 Tax=Paenibacillus flagellatus TaxID=2211139 RepID=A0A2V5KLZ9_9BACL|nr:nicotinate-nucleotide adenylyltransferase [Paenibacillus flagellatus]PYI51897.1 nicotinate-nucleotide adenylyltransferase [Paenibacillus flagellatus]